MARYIDSEKIAYFSDYVGGALVIDGVVYKSDIDKMPTADVQEVKHGKWEKPSEFGEPICSNCKKSPKIVFGNVSQYCPNCGAIMEQED